MNTTNHTSPSGEELKPCPFCGCTTSPELKGNGIGDNWLECVECGASTRLREDGAGSAKDWNRRAEASDKPAGEDAANGAPCELCKGVGQIGMPGQRCFACDGSGKSKFAALAANGAIVEREAFYIHRNVLKQLSSGLDQVDTRVYATQPSDRHVAVTRAALTAEKVAAEPIYQSRLCSAPSWTDVLRDEFLACGTKPTQFETRITYAAPQPAQTQAALTDEQIDDIADDVVGPGTRLSYARARAFARALLLAAQPVSGGKS